MNRQPLSDNILRRTGMNRQPLGDTDSSYVTLCDAMKHHIATTVQIVQHIHSITFPPHMLILQKGYYDYDNIFEAAASIFQSDNSSLYVQFYGQLDRTTAADPHRLTSHHLSLHWFRSRHRRFSWPICWHPFPTDRRQSFADKRNSKTRFSCKKGQYTRTVPKSSRSLWNLLTTYSAFPKKYYVYGSLHSPVHAVNLKATLQDIYRSFDDPYIIAIDAALGAKEHIGTVTLGDGALFPGIGVSKQLPAVGDIHITGIVNTINCQNRNLILQTTHLSTVVSLATFISKGIRQALLQQDLTCPCDPLVRDTK